MKKILISFIVVITIFSLIGCSQSEIIDNSEGTYLIKKLKHQFIEEGDLVAASMNEKICVMVKTIINKDDYICSLYEREKDSFSLLYEAKNIQDFTYDSLGNLIVLEKDESGKTFLVQLDEAGKRVSEIDITDIVSSMQGWMYAFEVDVNNNFYFMCLEAVVVLRDETGEWSQFDSQGILFDITKDTQGNILLASIGDECVNVIKVNLSENKLEDFFTLPQRAANYAVGKKSIFGCNSKFDFSILAEDGVYEINSKEGNVYKILDYSNASLASQNVTNFMLVSENIYLCFYKESSAEFAPSLYQITKKNEIKEKKEIVLAGIEIGDYTKEQVSHYNLYNEEYKIIIKDYNEYQNPQEKLAADILGGRGPDMLDLQRVPKEQYIKKDLLLDLNEYLEKEVDIAKDDFLACVIKAMSVDGKIYSLPAQFQVVTAMGAKSRLEAGYEGWTIGELQASMENVGEEQRVFCQTSSYNLLFGVLCNSEKEFWDDATEACNFDSKSFQQLLEITKKVDEYGKNEILWWEALQSGEAYIMTDRITDILSFLTYEKIFNGEIAFIGYPNQNRRGNSIDITDLNIAICSYSEYKDEAWKFIKSYLTSEYQDQYIHEGTFPTRRDSMENMLDFFSNPNNYVDPVRGIEMMFDAYEVNIPPLSEEQKNVFTCLLDSIEKEYKEDPIMFKIIEEEADAFYSGKKTAEEAAALIQNRVSIYLSEQW